MRLNLIVAMAKNRVIGIANKMPWHLPADFAWFKRSTIGHPIIMGRKTFESIGKPLPGRRNLVISRNAHWHADGCEVLSSLTAVIDQCRENENVFVIGGATLYNEALPLADTIYLTEVDASPAGDTWFPLLDSRDWKERSREHHAADDKNAFAMDFVVVDRIAGR